MPRMSEAKYGTAARCCESKRQAVMKIVVNYKPGNREQIQAVMKIVIN